MYKFTGEEKLDVCADIIAPLFAILRDPEIVKLERAKAPVSLYVKPALTNHRDEVVEVLARMATKEGVSPEEYIEGTGPIAIGMEFMTLLSDNDYVGLFNSQGQDKKTSSGSATANTEVNEK